MKKKLLLAISFIAVLVCIFTVSALAVEIDGIYYTLNDNNATATVNNENATKCTLENVVIPETVTYNDKEYTVTTIDHHAFSGTKGGWGKNQTIKTLYIPKTVSSIGNHFLRQCASIESVTIKAKNENGIELGDAEFYQCSSLKYLDMSESDITSFKQYTFYECKALTSDGLKLPPRLTKIGSQVFRSCTGLTSLNLIDLPVTEIGSWAFNGCSKLSSLKLPTSLVSIGNNCIQGTPVIGTLIFPDTFTTLANDAIAQIPMYMVIFPDVSNGHSYHSGAFHDVYPTVIIYEGEDYTDLTGTIDSFKGYTNVLPFSQYDPTVTYTQKTLFYGAELCDKCNGILEGERFNFTGYENDFYFASKCTNCQKENISEYYDAMFVNSGYSVAEYGDGAVTIGLTVNNASIAKYEETTGETVSFGLYAATKIKLGNDDIMDANGKMLDGIITAEMPKNQFSLIKIKLFGFETDVQKSTLFTMGAYVISEKDEKASVSYVQADAPIEGEKHAYVTYNSFI